MAVTLVPVAVPSQVEAPATYIGDVFRHRLVAARAQRHLVPFLRQRLGLGLDREDAFELYYNAAVTRWLGVSFDLQIVEPALKKALSSSGQLKDVKTTVVPARRAYVRF